MRRISLALALVGAVAAAGCSGGAKAPTDAGGAQGVAGGTFTVTVQNGQNGNTALAMKGGYVQSTPAGIDCGGSGRTACVATFPLGTNVTLTATPSGALDPDYTDASGNAYLPYMFTGWAGDCSGTSVCSLSGNADKYVLASFGGKVTVHPNFSAGHDFSLDCKSCHGSSLQGVGIAPACANCHKDGNMGNPQAPSTVAAKTGLAATITGYVYDSATNVLSVKFRLTDTSATPKPVDLAGVYSTNGALSNCGYGHSLPSQGCTNTQIGFALGLFTTDANGVVSQYKVYTTSTSNGVTSPTMLSPVAFPTATDAGKGKLVADTTQGNYIYTFPSTVVPNPLPAAGTFTAAMFVTRQENKVNADDSKYFTAVNAQYAWDVATGAATTNTREVATNCDKCHDGFKPEGNVSAAFHSGTKVQAWICNFCHNADRTSSPTANANIFVHRIHHGEELQAANVFHGINEVTYPQDIRNCGMCHDGARNGGQWKSASAASIPTCTSCHDTLSSATFAAASHHGRPAGSPEDNCNTCHGPTVAHPIDATHLAVSPPDAGSLYAMTGGNANTNAAWIAAAGQAPTGAARMSWEIQSVSKVGSNPAITFRVLKDGSPVTFGTYGEQAVSGTKGDGWVQGTTVCTDIQWKNAAGTAVTNGPCTCGDGVGTNPAKCTKAELLDGFVGSPSVYWVFALPQDGITAPADFNASGSAYLKDIWTGAATATPTASTGQKGTGWKKGTTTCTDAVPCDCSIRATCTNATKVVAGTIGTPDANGFYTVTLTSVTVPAQAKMLTGGVGYTYSLTSTQPLTQVNLAAYPYNTDSYTATVGAAKEFKISNYNKPLLHAHEGGLVVPAQNVWKAADQNDTRRTIVSNDKCNNCHAKLGVNPTFHAGQRNDAPSCSWCHTPNRTSSGWAANAKDFIHAIHGGAKRDYPFSWHSGTCASGSFNVALGICSDGALPAAPWYDEVTYPGRSCQDCHLAGTYDYSGAAAVAALPNVLASTVATGTYSLSGGKVVSPYVNTTGTDYGANFAFVGYDGGYVSADATTLATSPITAACFACHNSDGAKSHMTSTEAGGKVYAPRTQLGTEKCLDCHGPNTGFPIAKMHQ